MHGWMDGRKACCAACPSSAGCCAQGEKGKDAGEYRQMAQPRCELLANLKSEGTNAPAEAKVDRGRMMANANNHWPMDLRAIICSTNQQQLPQPSGRRDGLNAPFCGPQPGRRHSKGKGGAQGASGQGMAFVLEGAGQSGAQVPQIAATRVRCGAPLTRRKQRPRLASRRAAVGLTSVAAPCWTPLARMHPFPTGALGCEEPQPRPKILSLRAKPVGEMD